MNNFGDKLKRFFGCAAYGFGITIETVSNGKGILGNIAELSKGIGTEFLADVSESEFESFGNWLETHKFNKRFSRTLKSLTCAPDIWAAIVEIINGNATKRIKDTKHDKHSDITAGSVAAISRVWLNPYKKDYIVNSCKNSKKYTKLDEYDKACVRDILSNACDIYLEAAFEEFLNREDKILASVLISALGSKIDNYAEEIRAFTERHRIAEGTQLSYGKVQVTKIVEETFALVCSWCGNHIADNFVKDRSDDNKYICQSCGTACFMISHKANADEIADKISNKFAEFTAELYKKIDEDGKTTRARIDSAEIKINANIDSLRAALNKAFIEPNAKNGEIEAQNKLGDSYYSLGLLKNFKKPIKKFQPTAKNNDNRAHTTTAEKYFYGLGVKQNYKEAIKWCSLEECKETQNILGTCYYYGLGVLKNFKKAFMQYKLAADKGFAEAQYNLGECYYYGKGIRRDHIKAVKWYELAAEQGFSEAQFSLGHCYQHGLGVLKNYKEAVKWYELAATSDNTEAQITLGDFYYHGIVLTYDSKEAVKWYRLAADKGHTNAQYSLGCCYDFGYGVTQDYKEAVKWFRLAAEQGYAEAQFMLGECYYQGDGVMQDYKDAVKWYRLAAEQGYAKAQFMLGECYYQGDGVMQDYKDAVKWYRLAAKKDHIAAHDRLGACYIDGLGVLKNYKKAIKHSSEAYKLTIKIHDRFDCIHEILKKIIF